MDDELPLALLHLRESEIVRLCGLVRAARGQEYARQGKVRLTERIAGTLRATVLEPEASRAVAAYFAAGGLDAWECSCRYLLVRPASEGAEPPTGASRQPCEHVAALLSAWLRDSGQFRSPAPHSSGDPADAGEGRTAGFPTGRGGERTVGHRADEGGGVPPAPISLNSLAPAARRFLLYLALAGGSATEIQAQRLIARLDLDLAQDALPLLHQVHEAGWLQPIFATGRSRPRPPIAEAPAGWSIPEALLPQIERVAPLDALSSLADLREQSAPAGHLPAHLFLVAVQALTAQPPETDLPNTLKQRLNLAPDQAQFSLALLRLAGLLPAERGATPAPAGPSGGGAVHSDQPQLAPALAAPDALGLASGQAGEAVLGAYRFLLGRDPSTVLRDLWTLWLHAPSARELADLRDAGVRVAMLNRRDKALTHAIAVEHQAARALVADLLRSVPIGQWWSFTSWVEYLWRLRPDFLRGRQQAFLRPQWWLERVSDGQPLSLEVRTEWRQAEGRYLALLFRRALHWLGLLDLAFDAQGRLKAFRLTPLGASLLGAAPADEAGGRTAGLLTGRSGALLTDGRLLIPLATLSEATLAAALCWCQPAGATTEGLLVEPDARRVAASLDANHDLDAWLATLTPATNPDALKALVARLRGWAARYGQITLSPAVALLEVADPALLRELERAVDLTPHIQHPLAPGLVVLRPAAVETLLGELQRRGYTPWVVHDEATH